MVFDVMSLFMHVTTDLAVQVSWKQLESDAFLPKRAGLSMDDACFLLSQCLEAMSLRPFSAGLYPPLLFLTLEGTCLDTRVWMAHALTHTSSLL